MCKKPKQIEKKKIPLYETRDEVFVCTSCKTVFKYINNLYRHQKTCKKTPIKVHQCPHISILLKLKVTSRFTRNEAYGMVYLQKM